MKVDLAEEKVRMLVRAKSILCALCDFIIKMPILEIPWFESLILGPMGLYGTQ